jgi:hypothetical protein
MSKPNNPTRLWYWLNWQRSIPAVINCDICERNQGRRSSVDRAMKCAFKAGQYAEADRQRRLQEAKKK